MAADRRLRLSIRGWPRERLFAALGGQTGDRHRVTMDRHGHQIELSLPVSDF